MSIRPPASQSGAYVTLDTAQTITGTKTFSAATLLVAPAATTVPAIVRGAVGQTGDMTQWQDSAGEVLGRVVASGRAIAFNEGIALGSSTNPLVQGLSPSGNNTMLRCNTGAFINFGDASGTIPLVVDCAAAGAVSVSARRLQLNNGTYAGGTDVGGGVAFGTGAPVNANGANGDLYLRVDGGSLTTIYQRRAGAWVGIV